MSANASGCAGIPSSCCAMKVPEVLTITIRTGCGTYTAKLYYDAQASGAGTPTWTGSASIQCALMMPPPCNAATLKLNLSCQGPTCFACTCFKLAWGCSTLSGGVAPGSCTCEDDSTGTAFSLTFNGIIASDPTCNCGDPSVFTVTQ